MNIKELQGIMADSTPEVSIDAATLTALEGNENPVNENPVNENPQPEPEQQSRYVNLANFCATATGLYCGISDFVYKRVKKTETAPEWTGEIKEQLQRAVNDFLEGYNIPMSPAVELVATLITVEICRYTILKPLPSPADENK